MLDGHSASILEAFCPFSRTSSADALSSSWFTTEAVVNLWCGFGVYTVRLSLLAANAVAIRGLDGALHQGSWFYLITLVIR